MKNILVIRFSALGDVAMLAAVLKGISVPENVTISVLSRKQMAPLFEGVRFFGADLKGCHKGVKGLNRLLHDIDYKQFDAVIDCHNVLRSRYLDFRFRMAGKEVTIMPKARLAKWWLTCRWNKHKKALTPMPERYKQTILQRLSGHVIPDEVIRQQEKKNIGVAPFAAHRGKIYPLDKMEQVVAALSKTGEKIYLFGGGKEEASILENWAAKYPNTECVAGKMSLSDELELIRSLQVMITMDSGNMHLASLVGTRVVSIWGATHPMAGFLGVGQKEEDCIQRDLPCRPCSIYGKKKCRFADYRCLDIDPQTIIERVGR